MVIVICEKTGIEFEAENRRRKSHPTVMSWLEKAYQEGWYDQANAALYGSRYTQKQTFTTIEQFVSYFQDLQKSATQSKRDIDAAENQRQRDVAEAKRQRYITNSLLRGRGYNWSKFENDEEDVDMAGLPEVEWVLYSPDHRAVSVKEAMLELAFYEDAKFAHEWLASRSITEETPAIEVKRQQEATKAKQVQGITYTNEQIEYQQEAMPAFIEAGCTPEVAEREAKRLSLPHHSWEDHILLSPIRLPDTDNAALVINSDLRYGVIIADEWNGIDEIIERYPETRSQLSMYSERNRKVVL